MPNQKTTISSLKLVSRTPPEIPNIDVIHAHEKSLLAPMGPETNPWLENVAAIDIALQTAYISSLQEVGAKIAVDTICSAFGGRVTDGEISYYHERMAIAAPTEDRPTRVYKSSRVGVEEQGRMTGPGRMGGLGGWTLDKDAIAAALASYTHNFVAVLIAFFSRARLPLTRSVALPNLVLAETREPRQFVPPLSMKFDKLPSPMFTNIIRVSTPVRSSFWVELWDGGKSTLGKTEIVEVEPGTSELAVNHFLMPWETSGYVNIEPYDAPKGLVIESINILPPI